MLPKDLLQPHRADGITILGPDIIATDQDGKPLSPIAVVFPDLRVLVTGSGIHAELMMRGVEFLQSRLRETERRELTPEEEQAIYENVVSLLVRGSTVLIRSYPDDMERVFAADEILQQIVPKERIQFTGVHIPEVRDRMRRRGESWRISPAPRSIHEICDYIRTSRVHVNTRTTYYLNVQSGERFLTYEEFLKIRPLIRTAPQEALARLKEIDHLSRLVNDQGVPELSFFLPAEKKLPAKLLEDVVQVLDGAESPVDLERAEDLFDHFAATYAEAASDELTVDGEHHTRWQTTMFCRLYDINEKVLEEWALGLSPEFHLNVRWLPGAKLRGKDVIFEPKAEPRVCHLIKYFLKEWPEVVSVNVGRVEYSLTERDRTGEEREVYLIVLGLPHGGEEIRLVRLLKWDVIHRLKQGFPLARAIADTFSYYEYISDRLKGAKALELPIPSYTAIQFREELPKIGDFPVFFFDRRYVPGIVSDKIPLTYYKRKGFVALLARLLGIAAAASLVLGRASFRSGEIFFDDGDEVIQLDAEGLPERVIISETTGSFADSTTPILELLPQCLKHLAVHLEKARKRKIQREDLEAAVGAFTDALIAEIERMQSLLNNRSPALRSLFDGRPSEPGSIRVRWESILDRLAATDPRELRRAVVESPHLAAFVSV